MAKPILNEATIADYMKRNKCDRDEAIDLIKYDIAIENGEDTEYDLTEEQKKFVQDMNRKIDHKKHGTVKRERKPNELKVNVLNVGHDFLKAKGLKVNWQNDEPCLSIPYTYWEDDTKYSNQIFSVCWHN